VEARAKARAPLKLLKEVQQLGHEGAETVSAPTTEGTERLSSEVLKAAQSSSSNNSSKK
jgi:hypothetical protein